MRREQRISQKKSRERAMLIFSLFSSSPLFSALSHFLCRRAYMAAPMVPSTRPTSEAP